MISCTNYRGQSYNPISQFDCLSEDIPFLPKNKKGLVVKDVIIELSNAKNTIQDNTFLHKMKINDLPKNVNYIKINSLFIFGADDKNNIVTSISPSYETAPPNAPFGHYGSFNPLLEKIKIDDNYFIADVDIKKMTKVDIKDMQVVSPEVVKIKRIILDVTLYENNNVVSSHQIRLDINDTAKTKNNNNQFNAKIYNMSHITNGSVTFVMDTGEVYKFDEEYDRWLKV